MPKVLVAFVLFPVGLLILAGCAKQEDVSTPAERTAFKGTKATPADIAAAMERAKNAKPFVAPGALQPGQPPK
jgi:hypothetical protein